MLTVFVTVLSLLFVSLPTRVKARSEAVYPMPRIPAQDGWCLRTKGVPTANTRFTLNLHPNDADIILHFNPRLKWFSRVKVTVINYLQNGRWGPDVELKDPWPPFPFTPGVSFQMVITAISSYQFKVQVNGADYFTVTTVRPVSEITRVMFRYAIQIEYLSLWC